MSVVSSAILKSYFQTGDLPTKGQWVNFIDTLFSKVVGGIIPVVDTYTPDLTKVANITASESRECFYARFSTKILVAGVLSFTISASGGYTCLGISLPVDSNFNTNYHAGGSGTSDITNESFILQSDAFTHTLVLSVPAAAAGNGATYNVPFLAIYDII